MSFVWRRSLPSVAGLSGLLIGVGFAFVYFVKAPLWFPFAFAIAMILLQYAINPRIIEWLVPATIVPRAGAGYGTDHPLARILVERCKQANVPLVKLGIVDDGNPNAFTFGHTRGDARIWVTRGLLERLDERELDAVITHEVGHVKNNDFIVMTVAAVVPMILYLIYVSMRTTRDQARYVAIAAYIGWIISRFTLLALSRAREYAADHWSCEATRDGDALCSALVKIAYGMGSVDAARKNAAMVLAASGKRRQRQRVDTKTLRLQSMSAMGIFDPRDAVAMETALAAGVDPQRAIGALRWDTVNPWARVLEKLSSHPIVAHRFQALEDSMLPGRPSKWSVVRSVASVSAEVRAGVRLEFIQEAVLAIAPWAIMIPLIIFGAFTGSLLSIGGALIAAGLLFILKQGMRYPRKMVPVPQIASLIERLDASPVAGIDVEIKGRIIGRGFPGYVLSPDMVIQDESGFVPVLYANSIPFGRLFFSLARVREFLGQDVVARGWYRRMPGPVLELREVHAADGRVARGNTWWLRYVGSSLVLIAGFITLIAALTHA